MRPNDVAVQPPIQEIQAPLATGLPRGFPLRDTVTPPLPQSVPRVTRPSSHWSTLAAELPLGRVFGFRSRRPMAVIVAMSFDGIHDSKNGRPLFSNLSA
jgi:hypothetical protein